MERVLIIAGALHIGGAERVAANICRYADPGEFEFHYVVFEGYENVYGPEIEAMGGKVITLPSPKAGYLRYCRELARLIRTYRYSAVHSHTQFNSGINLLVAKTMRVPLRIAHSHTTKTEGSVSIIQRGYEHVMRWVIRKTATHLLACGVEAGNWMFGEKTFRKKGSVLINGIDAAANAFSEENRRTVRRSYGIAPEAFVVGHAGTLLPVKNQDYLIRLMPEIRKVHKDAVLLMLGAGSAEERARLEGIAKACGVLDSVLFAGGVQNVNEVLSAMDVFVFPSLREGTPLALLEAQANGLPCVISDCIPNDAIITDLVTPLSLNDPASWTCAIIQGNRKDPSRYTEQIIRSGYDCHSAYRSLYALYRGVALVSFSFDDGRGDNTEAVDGVFLPQGLPVTLNITTGYIDGTCPETLCPSATPPMKREDVERFAAIPLIEIAMHGDQHLNTEEDIIRCSDKLHEWLGLDKSTLLGFASPGSGLSVSRLRNEENRKLQNSAAYFRISYRITSKKLIRNLSRKAARLIHIPLLYRIAYHDTVMTRSDGKIVYSIPVMGDVTVRQLLSIIRYGVRHRDALVLMFHSIEAEAPRREGWTWRTQKLKQLCVELSRMESLGRLQVCTTMELFLRLQERK